MHGQGWRRGSPMIGDHILLFGFAALAALSVVGVFALLLRAVEEIVEKAMADADD